MLQRACQSDDKPPSEFVGEAVKLNQARLQVLLERGGNADPAPQLDGTRGDDAPRHFMTEFMGDLATHAHGQRRYPGRQPERHRDVRTRQGTPRQEPEGQGAVRASKRSPAIEWPRDPDSDGGALRPPRLTRSSPRPTAPGRPRAASTPIAATRWWASCARPTCSNILGVPMPTIDNDLHAPPPHRLDHRRVGRGERR